MARDRDLFPPPRSDVKVWPDECAWTTQGRPCRIRPSAHLSGGRAYCSWHHYIALMGAPRLADDFETYAEYVQDLQDRNICAMETHYPAPITFAWTRGERRPEAITERCASYTCSVRLRQEAQTPARRGTPEENAAGFAKIRAILSKADSLSVERTERGMVVVDPAIRADLERRARPRDKEMP